MGYDAQIFELLRFLLGLIPEFTLGSLLWNVFFSFVIIVFMIIFHEAGHKAALYKFTNQDVKIRWGFKDVEVGTQEQINSLTDDEYLIVIGAGVLIGFIPFIIIVGAGIIVQFFQGLVFAAYMIASNSDIKVLINSIRNKKKKKVSKGD